mmetsp:Transcript_27531/g.46597  ORF Transcript_27531/g.46597 Transcript_27531/m.46597 type:complete len:90 (-) Transcript_27531:324-593(-)
MAALPSRKTSRNDTGVTNVEIRSFTDESVRCKSLSYVPITSLYESPFGRNINKSCQPNPHNSKASSGEIIIDKFLPFKVKMYEEKEYES